MPRRLTVWMCVFKRKLLLTCYCCFLQPLKELRNLLLCLCVLDVRINVGDGSGRLRKMLLHVNFLVGLRLKFEKIFDFWSRFGIFREI